MRGVVAEGCSGEENGVVVGDGGFEVEVGGWRFGFGPGKNIHARVTSATGTSSGLAVTGVTPRFPWSGPCSTVAV